MACDHHSGLARARSPRRTLREDHEAQGRGGVYDVRADGQPTRATIVKDETARRKWGDAQEWDVEREVAFEGEARWNWLFTARSLEGAHTTLQTLANSFRGDF